MPRPQTMSNPFYLLLLVVGVLFAITACCYGVMMVQSRNPFPTSSPLLQWIEEWGTIALATEIGVLAVLMLAAFGTDGYWTKE